MTPFSLNIRRARTRRKLTIADAARLCGVSLAAWYSYEAGKELPNVSRLLYIADKLNTTGTRLLAGVTLQNSKVKDGT